MSDWNEDNFLERLFPRLREKRAAHGSACPDADALCAFAEDRLEGVARDAIALHVAGCSKCAEVRARLLNFTQAGLPADEREWADAEKRLGNWMDGFLREQRSPVHPDAKSEPRRAVAAARGGGNWWSAWKLQWILGAVTALALLAAAAVLLKPILFAHRDGQTPIATQQQGQQPQSQTGASGEDNSTAALKETPASLRLEVGTRLRIKLSSLTRLVDGKLKFSGTLFDPVPLTGDVPLEEGTPVDGIESESDGKTSLAVTDLVVQGTHYRLSVPPGQPNAQAPGKKIGSQLDSDQVMEMFIAKDSVFEKQPAAPPEISASAANQNPALALGQENQRRDSKGRPKSVTLANGDVARISPQGRIVIIHSRDTTIYLRGGGARRIVTLHPDGSAAISSGRRQGFVQHPFTQSGRTYFRRTYVDDGRIRARVYARYHYHGAYYSSYVPAFYYSPKFYDWAVTPWPAPVAYSWGWGSAPWFGYYGGYFSPFPVYAVPTWWLADYAIAANLQAAYAAQDRPDSAAGEAAAASAQSSRAQKANDRGEGARYVTPETKAAIAEEVKKILAAEWGIAPRRPEQSTAPAQPGNIPEDGQLPAALDPSQRILVVAGTLAAATDDGGECTLSQGEVITRLGDTPDEHQQLRVTVLASLGPDCAPGTEVSVLVDELQEMQNQFRERIEDGLAALADIQGKNGLPKAPDAVAHPSALGKTQPDPAAPDVLREQQKKADELESQVRQEVGMDNDK